MRRGANAKDKFFLFQDLQYGKKAYNESSWQPDTGLPQIG
jgi:hypothetical protein